jgi:membrane protein implicated in regulation of membrane protease activity
MNDTANLAPYIFGAITLVGVLYFAYNIIFGGLIDADVDLSLDTDGDANFGTTVVAAFLAAFGAFGLLGTLSSWSLPLTLGVAVIAGGLIGRAALAVLRMVVRQQSTVITGNDALIGSSGRVTIDAPPGATTQVMVEDKYVTTYAAREVDNHALNRGDHVEVVNIENGTLYVKKKRMG